MKAHFNGPAKDQLGVIIFTHDSILQRQFHFELPFLDERNWVHHTQRKEFLPGLMKISALHRAPGRDEPHIHCP